MDLVYPLSPSEWRRWIDTHLSIGEVAGISLVSRESFPLEKLVEL